MRGTAAAPTSADLVLDDARVRRLRAQQEQAELRGRKSVTVLTGARGRVARGERRGARSGSRPPSPPEFTLPAGESATVHTMHVPAPVLVRRRPGLPGRARTWRLRGGAVSSPVGLADSSPATGRRTAGAVVLSLGEGGHAVSCPVPETSARPGCQRRAVPHRARLGRARACRGTPGPQRGSRGRSPLQCPLPEPAARADARLARGARAAKP